MSIDAASQSTIDKRQGKNDDDWDSSRRDIVNFLEEWDEPFQSNRTENVSGDVDVKTPPCIVGLTKCCLERSHVERYS